MSSGPAPSSAIDIARRATAITFDVGSIRFTTLDTPGHTPEHVSYAVADTTRADEPFLLLTGGSLLVGAVGRTDLLGAEHAGPYAAAMYRSLHDVLLRHEDSVMVYPTHGAGSLCSTGIASTSWSTIGYERRHDPLLGPLDVDAFARALLAGQPTIPRYFARMRPTNQAGPRLLGATVPAIEPLDGDDLDAALRDGALVVDTRTPEAHALQHIPGSLSIPAGSSFGTWLGWVVDADRPVVLLVNDVDDLDDLARQALRIGFEFDRRLRRRRAASVARVGADDPGRRRRSTSIGWRPSSPSGGPDEAPVVIDVRQASEFEAGHVPGSIHIGAGELPAMLDRLPRDRPIATICASGYRSSVAASMLRAAGFEQVVAVSGGLPDWQARGYPLTTAGADGPRPAGPRRGAEWAGCVRPPRAREHGCHGLIARRSAGDARHDAGSTDIPMSSDRRRPADGQQHAAAGQRAEQLVDRPTAA